jgi:hypothetical protein
MQRKPHALRTALILASATTTVVFACSDSSSRSDDDASGGTGAKAGASGSAGRGSSGAGGTTGQAGSSGSAGRGNQAGTGATAGTGAAAYTVGELLGFVPGTGEVPYAIGDNPYGIHGGAFLARAPNGNTVTVADEPGKICISGSLEEVPNGDYMGYWGIEIGFNLNQIPTEGGGEGGAAGATGAAGAAGAGGAGGEGGSGSAGAPPDMVGAWNPGNVVGFSYVIEGATISPMRFKSLPFGLDAAAEASVYCKPLMLSSGVAEDSLFSQLMQYCWDMASMTPLPLASGLANISWQLPGDVNTGVREFDWCLSDLRPLLMK